MIRYGHGMKIEGWGNEGNEKQVKKLLDDFIAHNNVGRIVLSNIARPKVRDQRGRESLIGCETKGVGSL
jgi:hypothetical protein